MKKFYFDYAATTPVDKRVVKAMEPYYADVFGNPGSRHKFGQEASAAVFKARNKIAKLINCDYREIIFTGSATEANSLALRGVVKNVLNARSVLDDVNDKEQAESDRTVRTSETFLPRIITSQIEHESVLETCRDLEKEGLAEVIYLPVSKNGIVDLKKMKAALNGRTILVSIMHVNNEIGSIQPISEIVKIIKEFKIKNINKSNFCHSALACSAMAVDAESRKKDWIIASLLRKATDGQVAGMTENNSLFPLFHTDAAQAFNYLDCDIKKLGVDMMTLSSQKIYGPKGVGLLYIKNFGNFQGKKFISPIITGGGQEEGLRSGTENIAGIVGFVEAIQIAFDSREKESQRLLELQNYFLKKLKSINRPVRPGQTRFVLNGPATGEGRLPNNINIYSSAKKDLIFKLDMAGFAVSGGSACSARMAKPSHVLKALGRSDEKASESIRISFGRQTTKQLVDKLLTALKKAV